MNSANLIDNSNFRRFLNDTLKEIMSLISAEGGSLFMFDSSSKELVLDSSYSSGVLKLKGLRQRVGEGVSGKVVDIRRPILVTDIDTDLRFRKNGFTHYKTKSFISIPLFTGQDGLIGLMNFTDKFSGEPFSPKDLEVAVAISQYACLTLESLSNYVKLQEEKDVVEKQKALLNKYASIGKLASGIVHEINNPLDGITRYVNMLLEKESVATNKDYLQEVKNGLKRIAGITQSLLEFSYLVNSRPVNPEKSVDIYELINESLDMFRDRLSNSSIQVHKKFSQPALKVSDVSLQHVFVNLIKNALDAMPRGGMLNISSRVSDTEVEIDFQDTGSGIPDDIKERIFEPFFTTKEKGRGTGLGLSICKEIINRLEGKIEVKSIIGKGSAFTVVIPKKHLKNV